LIEQRGLADHRSIGSHSEKLATIHLEEEKEDCRTLRGRGAQRNPSLKRNKKKTLKSAAGEVGVAAVPLRRVGSRRGPLWGADTRRKENTPPKRKDLAELKRGH